MKSFQRRKKSFLQELKTLRQNEDDEIYYKKEQSLKDKEVEKLLFKPYLIQGKNDKNNNQMITSFFK